MDTTARDQGTPAAEPADGATLATTASRSRRGVLASLSPIELMLVARAKIQWVAEDTDPSSFVAWLGL
jgi:hypothetical protein